MIDNKTIAHPQFTNPCDVKAYLATGDFGLPHLNARYLCNRMVPMFGETYAELLERLHPNSYRVPEFVSTSPVQKIIHLAGNVYLVKTLNTDYIVKITVEQEDPTSKKTYLAYSNHKPVVGKRFTCSRMEDDDFTTPVTCNTSPVQKVHKVARNIWQVETENSHYFVCVISD